jgi:hypothetical protein
LEEKEEHRDREVTLMMQTIRRLNRPVKWFKYMLRERERDFQAVPIQDATSSWGSKEVHQPTTHHVQANGADPDIVLKLF